MSAIDLGTRYEFLRELGSGGMGQVLLVRDLYLQKELALKLLHLAPATPEDLEPFQKEFALLCEIEHPRIARAHDFGFHAGRPFYTSEYVEGSTLAERSPLLGGNQVLEIAVDVAEALAFLHSRGILHLDLKPSNIIIAAAARRGPVLIDFGLFRRGLLGPPGPRIKGSLPYMAPEHFSGGPLTPRTDVYALGVMLYRVATGSFPRSGPTESSSRLDDERAWSPAPRPPSEAGVSPPAIDGIVLKCLALEPSARYASAVELLDALRRAGSAQAPRVRPEAAVSSLIGREAELAEAEQFIRGIQARGESPPALLVTAAPGMGQTHFLREVKVRAQTQGLELYLETGYPGRTGSPGSLLRALGASKSSDKSDASTRWTELLARLARPGKSPPIEATEGERRLRRATAVGLAASAVKSPMILAADGLQHWDEISIALLFDLVRFLCERPRAERPPIGVVAAYREEGTSTALLRELTAYLLEPRHAQAISLRPLGLKETAILFRDRRGAGAEAAKGLSLFQKTRGVPSEIVAMAMRTSHNRPSGDGEAPLPNLSGLDVDGRTVLATLRLLRRPAAPLEISRFTEISSRRLHQVLERLSAAGLALRPEESSATEEWIASDSAARVPNLASRSEERKIHRAVAQALVLRGRHGAKLVEAVHHFRAAGCKQAVKRYGLAAARYLKSTHQNRAAIDLLRAVLEATPERQPGPRLEAAIEAAELHGRVGELDEGIRLLRDLLPQARKLRGTAHARVLLRLACLHSRSGDFRRADALFQEASRMAVGKRALELAERLTLLNEHASLKVIVGELEVAVRLCEEGLRLAGKSREPSLREAALNLHATRANVSLRTADFEGAIQSYLSSLEIAEALGSPANQAAILNNLGIVYNQCDRYEEAISAFREAEKTSLHLDEGPSLASIYGNLAVLYSKTGDFHSMEMALEAGERLLSGAIGKRQEFFLKHARGLSLINRGRYRQARASLEEAMAMGTAMGDLHVAAFDEVYRVEALIFEGQYAEADKQLERLSAPESPGRVRKMAHARRAFLAAITGRRTLLESSVACHAELAGDRPIPFLDAWETLFIAWAFSINGKHDEAARRLEPAAQFFEMRSLAPAASLASWVLSEAQMLEAASDRRANHSLHASPDPLHAANDLTAVLGPLLEARRLLECSRSPADRARCSDFLANAAAALSANPLPEWSLRLDALRALLRPDRSAALAEVKRRREEMARGLSKEHRVDYLASPHWKAWTEVAVPEAEPEAESATIADARTTEVFDGLDASSQRARLVARSSGMRRVLSTLDRLRGKELPVLIRGETGSGKELVARVIHEESGRSAGPFRVLDCTTIPPALLESELFGARAGAFTGIDEDRAGLLTAAAGGSVFIDEIGGAPLDVQAKLLRVLSEGRIRPLGSEDDASIDVRFLFSTSHDLDEEVRQGAFREDLLYRIRVVTVDLPSLRDRPEDLEGLVASILTEVGANPPAVESGVLERLRELPWPGNVRELRNFIARLRFECPERITVDAVERIHSDPKTTSLFPKNLLARERLASLKAQLERDYIVYHFRRLGGDTEALREFLGVGRRQLYRRCARLGVVLREVRST